GARLGTGHRADMGFLLRIVRSATDHVRGLAAVLRPHRAVLLPGSLSGGRRAEAAARSPAVLLRANGLLARDVPPWHPATAPGPPDQPVPPGPAALSPAGQSVDPRRGAARGQPQPAKRPRTEQGGTGGPGQTPAGGGLPARGGPGVGPLEQGDLR